MALDCLLLTSEATVLKTVQASLSAYEVSLEVRKDVPSALELANHRHFDGFVIDCDGVPGGLDVLTAIRHTSANRKQSVILAIVNGATGISSAFDSGAQFVLWRPQPLGTDVVKARSYGDQMRKSLVRRIFPIPSRRKVVSARSAPILFRLGTWQRSREEESRRVFLALRPMQLGVNPNSGLERARTTIVKPPSANCA